MAIEMEAVRPDRLARAVEAALYNLLYAFAQLKIQWTNDLKLSVSQKIFKLSGA